MRCAARIYIDAEGTYSSFVRSYPSIVYWLAGRQARARARRRFNYPSCRSVGVCTYAYASPSSAHGRTDGRTTPLGVTVACCMRLTDGRADKRVTHYLRTIRSTNSSELFAYAKIMNVLYSVHWCTCYKEGKKSRCHLMSPLA